MQPNNRAIVVMTNLIRILMTNLIRITHNFGFKVYSKWSYAFLDLPSSECTCTLKKVQESFNATTIFPQLRLDIFQEVRVGSIKSKLPCMPRGGSFN